MIKKLSLSDFLSSAHTVNVPLTFQPKEFDGMSYSMLKFYKTLSEHSGIFIINGVVYNSIIPSINNLYFFIKESVDVEYLLSFEAIIDIKQKELNEFVIFYYPNNIITVSLRNFNNVKKIKEPT